MCSLNPNKSTNGEKEPTCSGSSSTSTASTLNEKPFKYSVLTPKAIANLPKYQYDGIDRSLIYKYILSPLAGYLVEKFTPTTVAPNTITLFGLALMLSSYLNIYYHCPTLEQCDANDDSIPGYIFLLNGIAILTYQTLDNMDGKQARKTGSSSPLGLLFDHGCDAINSIFGSVTWICAFGLVPDEGNLVHLFIMVFGPMLVFYVSTWEEYYTHRLDLPLINGPSEGLILAAGINITTWWFGRSFWHRTELYDFALEYAPAFVTDSFVHMSALVGLTTESASKPLQNYNVLVLMTLLSITQEIIPKIIGVAMSYGFKTIKDLAPMIALMTWSFMIVHADPQIFLRNERWCFHLSAILFVEMVTRLMLDHITGEIYKPLRKTLVPLFLLHYILVDGTLRYDQIDSIIWLYTGFVFVYWGVMAKLVIRDISHLLQIWCFDIVTPRKKGDTQIGAQANKKDS